MVTYGERLAQELSSVDAAERAMAELRGLVAGLPNEQRVRAEQLLEQIKVNIDLACMSARDAVEAALGLHGDI